jgi:anaerobic magnesium-protoporphyrin IX monomethyl ester cyclase
MGQLDLLLINPGARAQVYRSLANSLAAIEPPIWCGLLAAFVGGKGFSVKIIDADAENLSPAQTADRTSGYNPVLAAIVVLGANPSASSTPKMTAAGEIASELKKRDPRIKIIFIGLHPSALPEQTLNEEKTDFVCQGEGFHTLIELLPVLKSNNASGDYKIPGLWYRREGGVVSNLPASLVNPDDLPMAAWELLPMDKYRAHNWHCFEHLDQRQPYAVIYTSLGCPFNCSYCNVRALYNDKPGIRFRSPEKVVGEIDFLVNKYGIKNLKILDELFALGEERVRRICDLIIRGGYDLNIWAYARVDTVNERMLKEMKKAGINWLAYGFESASDVVRQGVSKKTKQETTNQAIETTRRAGIYIIGNFIFGLPDDNLETMQQTLEMAKEYNFEYVNFYTAMAYPGSQLYTEAVKQGIQLPGSWTAYGQYAEDTLPLPTRYLAASEVLRFRDGAFKEYFSNPEYLASISEKFGPEAVEHVKEMLKHEIRRKNMTPSKRQDV